MKLIFVVAIAAALCAVSANNIDWALVYQKANGLPEKPACLSNYVPANLDALLADIKAKDLTNALHESNILVHSLNDAASKCVDPLPANMVNLGKVLDSAEAVNHVWVEAKGIRACGLNITTEFTHFLQVIHGASPLKIAEATEMLFDKLLNQDLPRCATELGLPLAQAFPDILIRVSKLIGTPLPEEKIKCMQSGFDDFDRSFTAFEQMWEHNSKAALTSLSAAFARLRSQGNRCNAPIYASIFGLLQSTIIKHSESIVSGTVAAAEDVTGMIDAFNARDWDAFMNHLGNLCGRVLPLVSCDTHGCKMAASFLDVVSVIAHDFHSCESALEDVYDDFKKVGDQWSQHAYGDAVRTTEAAISGISNAMDQCGLADIAKVIGGSVEKVADAAIKYVHGETKVLVRGLDITAEFIDLVEAIEEHEWETVGIKAANLVVKLLSLDCHSDYCRAAIDLFREMGTMIGDMDTCVASINKSGVPFHSAVASWHKGDYVRAIESIMDGIVAMGNALTDCDVSRVADLLVSEGETLKNAKVTRIGQDIKVVLNGADITTAIAELVKAVLENKPGDIGKAIAHAVQSIHSANCTSTFCVVISDILSAARLMVPDLPKCEADVTDVVKDFEQAATYFNNGNTARALDTIAAAVDAFAEAAIDCHLDDLANLLKSEGDKLKSEQLKQIANDIHLFVDGAVVYDSIYLMIEAVTNMDMENLGKQLGRLIAAVKDLGCDSRSCKIITAVLQTFDDIIVDLGPCQHDLGKAWSAMEKSFEAFSHAKYSVGMHDLGFALEDVAAAIHKCHIPELAGDLTALAGLVKVAKIQNLDFEKGWDIVVAGASIIDDIHSLQIGYETKNNAIIARAIADILKQVVTLAKELCDEDDKACLVGTGVLKTIVNIPNLGACIQDFREVFNSVIESVHDAERHKWKHAAKDLGEGIHFLSLALHDCDVEDIALALVTVAEKLGVPGLGWVSTAVKLFIDGVDLIDSFRALVLAFQVDPTNWLAVGISVGQIVRIILRDLTDIPGLFGEVEMSAIEAAALEKATYGGKVPTYSQMQPIALPERL